MTTKTYQSRKIKIRLLLLFLLSFYSLLAQHPDNFAPLTDFEKNLTVYEKDSSANAVVLYEKGNYFYKYVDHSYRLVFEYHAKIKVLNQKGFDEATILIHLRKSHGTPEKIKNFKAITHNSTGKFKVHLNEIHNTDANAYRVTKSFAFPRVKIGSVLEYQYTIESPFTHIKGWNFQSNLPKIYSEYNAKIPAYYNYNRSLIGALKLDVNEASIEKNCFRVNAFVKFVDCEILKYAMRDIPAFRIDKNYMLAASNYISRIDFEISELKRWDGNNLKYTKSWKDVDNEFKGDINIGKQLNRTFFFENQMPESLLKEGSELQKAKKIFAFVQNHFTWNKNYGIYGKARVKDAFANKIGNVSEINMSLINLLTAADIKANLMLISTRDEGLPKLAHPVMSDFNYSIAKITIDNIDYLLDATDKYNPFGMLPFRALNRYGRVMDFKLDSYWQDIIPEKKNRNQVRAMIKFNLKEKKAYGMLEVINLGYYAINKRKVFDKSNTEEEYLNKWKKDIAGDFEINEYELKQDQSNDSKVVERVKFELQNLIDREIIYFNPFLAKFFNKNPFKLEERNYPVDFGYQRDYKYSITIEIPEGYKVHELPKEKKIVLGKNLVSLSYYQQTEENQITISLNLSINTTQLESSEYNGLKQVFKNLTDIQNNSLVVLKKE